MRHILVKQIQLGGYEVTCLVCGEKTRLRSKKKINKWASKHEGEHA